MSDAQELINILIDGGIDVCFANPGTSEMHFVTTLDTVVRMYGVPTFSTVWPPVRPAATRI